MYRIYFGKTAIDLTDVEQIVEISQTKAITQAIDYLGQMNSGPVPIKESIVRCVQVMKEKGLDGLSPKISGHFAQFRDIELSCALNRQRTTQITQQ